MNTESHLLRIVRRSLDHPDSQRLIAEVQAEYAVLYGTPDDAPIDVAEFDGDAGAFFVAHLDGVPEAVGTVAWRRIPTPASLTSPGADGASAELKRMFVRPSQRRGGLAREMLAAVEDAARACGVRWMVLETGLRQPEAIALYSTSGYEPLDDFGHYTASGLARAFVKEIAAGGR